MTPAYITPIEALRLVIGLLPDGPRLADFVTDGWIKYQFAAIPSKPPALLREAILLPDVKVTGVLQASAASWPPR